MASQTQTSVASENKPLSTHEEKVIQKISKQLKLGKEAHTRNVDDEVASSCSESFETIPTHGNGPEGETSHDRIIMKNEERGEWLKSERGHEWTLKWKEHDFDFCLVTSSQHLQTIEPSISVPDILSHQKAYIIFMKSLKHQQM